jgi:hypothetical protein
MAKRNARGTKGRTNSGKVKKGFRGKMRGNNNAKKKTTKQPRRSKTSNRKPGRPKGSKNKKK